jgi:hypothetical protein
VEKLEAVRVATAARRRRLTLLGRAAWAAGVFVAGTVGYFGGKSAAPQGLPPPTAEDLQVLQHRDYWPLYENLDSWEFLTALSQPDLFGEDL